MVCESGTNGSSHEGMGSVTGLTRDCSVSNCEWRVSSVVCGWAMISLVCEALMVARLRWSLALGCCPTVVLRLLEYFEGRIFIGFF